VPVPTGQPSSFQHMPLPLPAVFEPSQTLHIRMRTVEITASSTQVAHSTWGMGWRAAVHKTRAEGPMKLPSPDACCIQLHGQQAQVCPALR
jgi:hypothetical protein